MGRRRRTRAPAQGDRPPALPGHEIVGPVGFGAGGAVWSGRDAAGRDVVVSVLALAAGEAGAAQLRRLAALRGRPHPHLARTRQVVRLDGGRCAVVSDRVPGPTLATVLAARGRLTAPEVAGLLSAVGSALGHLHERGVVHGDVSPANVVLGDDGAPVLVDLAGHGAHDLGTPGFVPPERARGGVAGAPGDVWALARLVARVAGDCDPHLRSLLGAALDADPARRPSARDLASRAPGIAPAGPVLVPAPAVLAQARMRDDSAPTRRRPATRRAAREAPVPAPGLGRAGVRARSGSAATAGRVAVPPAARGAAPPAAGAVGRSSARGAAQLAAGGATRPATRRAAARARPAARHVRGRPAPPRWLGGALTLGVAALLTALIGWSGPLDRAGSYGHRPGAAVATAEPAHAVGDLLARRDGALVAGDAVALAATTVPGSPAAREDVVLLERLQETGTALEHLRTEVTGVEAVTTLADGVAVDVVVAQAAHDRVVTGERLTVPAQPARCARVVLSPGAGGSWQILRSGPCP